MPAKGSSIVRGDTALVRIIAHQVWLRGRHLSRHGQHGSLIELPLADALQLIDAKQAKLPGGIHRQALREAVAEMA